MENVAFDRKVIVYPGVYVWHGESGGGGGALCSAHVTLLWQPFELSAYESVPSEGFDCTF